MTTSTPDRSDPEPPDEPPDPGSTVALEALLAEQRYGELRRRLEACGQAPELQRLRGELALRGYGPPSDAILAARRLLAASEEASVATSEAQVAGAQVAGALVAGAACQAAQAGARSVAQELLARAQRCWPGEARLALAQQMLTAGRYSWPDPTLWRAEGLLTAGDGAAARAALRRLVESDAAGDPPSPEDPELHQRALQLLAALSSASGEHRAAAALLDRSLDLFPRGDRALVRRLQAALERWAGRQAAEALGALRALREATRDDPAAAARHVHRAAVEALASVDRAAEERPRWLLLERAAWAPCPDEPCPGRAALGLLGQLLGAELATPGHQPTAAHLRHAMARGSFCTLRLTLDEARIEAALRLQTPLLLEEERPTETGFLLVAGFDPVARLLLLIDPRRPGPLLRTVEEQWRRSELFGRGALLVVGPQERSEARLEALSRVGLEPDPRLELVDRCDLDASGAAPSPARVAALAAEAISAAPELPMLHLRHGESLLEQLRAGQLEPAPAGPFERWLAATRLRFPDAEWPFQIYAEALELQRRYEEAGIAWADALCFDPFDERNVLGQARVLVLQRRQAEADRMYRRALALRPDHVSAHIRRSELALTDGRLEEAALEAELAASIQPDDSEALLALATVREWSGEAGAAMELLRQVARADAEHVSSRVRLIHLLVDQAQWEEARQVAEELCALAPGRPRSWSLASWVCWCSGQAGRALELAVGGVQRCGPEPELLRQVVRVIATVLPEAAANEAVVALADQLSAEPSSLLDAASGFTEHGWYAPAVTLADRALELLPSDPNPGWRLAQILLSSAELRRTEEARIEGLLQQTIELTRSYPFPRVILAWRRLHDDPEQALRLLEEAEVPVAPAPIWYIQALALEQLGRSDEAADARGRLPELYPDGALEPIGTLRYVGLVELCRALLAGVLEVLPDHVETRLEQARTLGALGDAQGQLEALLALEAEQADAVPPSWLLDAADEAGRWEVVVRAADALIARIDSSAGLDSWRVRGQRAGAQLALGDEAAATRLVERAPHHPAALQALVSIERRLKHPRAAEDGERLARVAPGASRSLAARARHQGQEGRS